MFTPTYVLFIVLELPFMLALSKGQLNFETIQVSYVKFLALNMNVDFIKIFRG